MSRSELDAAGITDTDLRTAYARCRAVNARHGRTYFLATRLLAPWQRPAVHALYGFARWVDDLVDQPSSTSTSHDVGLRLTEVGWALRAALDGEQAGDPLLAAVAHTARRFHLDAELFESFLHSMRMDLSTTEYSTRAALDEYVHGSAEVIGLQVLPVLGTTVSTDEAAEAAAALGKAFQLTNFLRDVAEDLGRGRVYLPLNELAVFGVDRELLSWCNQHGWVDPRVRRALADQIALTRGVYRRAHPGVAMLHPVSRPCVSTALNLYSRILDEIEVADYDVFRHRATVSTTRRLSAAGSALVRAHWTRLRQAPPEPPRQAGDLR